MCIKDDSFRHYRRLRSSSNIPSVRQFINVASVSVDDYFAVLNCSTPERVLHHRLDWYFQTHASRRPPRVIWQSGRSNIRRYVAYSPDQIRHFLQIKPVHYNDSGTYMCLDQTTGFYAGIELIVRKFLFNKIVDKNLFFFVDNSRSYARKNVVDLQMITFVYLILRSLFLSRYIASDMISLLGISILINACLPSINTLVYFLS